MKKLMGFVSIGVLAGLTGCISITENATPAALSAKSDVYLEPTVSVGEKVSGSATGYQILRLFWFGPSKFADGMVYNGASRGIGGGFLSFLNPYTKVKAAAAYEAMSSSKADILVAPNYLVNDEDYFLFQKLTATVDARKGKIEGFNQLKKGDSSKVITISAGK